MRLEQWVERKALEQALGERTLGQCAHHPSALGYDRLWPEPLTLEQAMESRTLEQWVQPWSALGYDKSRRYSMEDVEIQDRARRVLDVFRREALSTEDQDLHDLLTGYDGITGLVGMGEYHRDGTFQFMVRTLERMGFDMARADCRKRRHSRSFAEAASNARDDSLELLTSASYEFSPLKHIVVLIMNRADNLIASITSDGFSVDKESDGLRELVLSYIRERGQKVEKVEMRIESACDEVRERKAPKPHGNVWDMPEQVLRPIPKRNARRPHPRRSTVCLWDDGTETHAAPSEGTPYDPVVGLAVCLVKRLCDIGKGGGASARSVIAAMADVYEDMGTTRGMDADAAYTVAVMGAGNLLYANGVERGDHPKTFDDLLLSVLEYEVNREAEAEAMRFRDALKRMRTEGGRMVRREAHKRDLEKRRWREYRKAVKHGASSMFEAWKYSVEAVPDEGPGAYFGEVSSTDMRHILETARAEARARLDATREGAAE